MLESCALVINCRIWELMSSTLEEKTHRTDDRDRDINTAWGWIARPVEVPGGLFHDGCGLVAISSNREAYEARGMAACGIIFESSDHLSKVFKKNKFSGGVRGELCPKAKNCVSILLAGRSKSSVKWKKTPLFFLLGQTLGRCRKKITV